MKLVLPTLEHKALVEDFYDEIKNDINHIIGFGEFKNFNAWLADMQSRLTGHNLSESMVKESYYLCFDRYKLIGVLSIKHELNEYLFNYGGHIGYAVRQSERNKGYATAILATGLKKAKELNLSKLLIVCNKNNIASAKTILNNGGILEDEILDPYENVIIQRYWINAM